jgi:predicted DNA-binding transcriptional regulator AlpA
LRGPICSPFIPDNRQETIMSHHIEPKALVQQGERLKALVKEAVKALVKEAVKEALNEQRPPNGAFTRPELIAHLRMGKTTFDRLEAEGDGPRKTRLSKRRICYMPEDVKAWQEARREKGAA